jgi:transcription elongation factor Elf1
MHFNFEGGLSPPLFLCWHVAQWWSTRLLTDRLWVRAPPLPANNNLVDMERRMINIVANKKGSMKTTSKSPIKSNKTTTKIDKIKPIEDDLRTEFYCSVCGKKYLKQKDNFPASQSPLYFGNNKFLNICNNCFDNIFIQYSNMLGDEDKAIERICMKYDIYFNDSLCESSKKISADRSRIKTYVSRANLQQYAGRTYDTTLSERESDAITTLEEFNEVKEGSDSKVTANTIKLWGFGFSLEDYEFLNNQFSDWKAKCVIDGKARESLVRELCIIKLQQNKSLLANKIDLYDKLTGTYQKVLVNANLQPKQEDANEKAGEKPMGVMIEMFEKERPVPEPLDEWRDVDGIIRFITIYFLGHLCKMLNIKNKYSKLYEDEMQKYRVEIPELEDLEDDEVFDYIINNDSEDTYQYKEDEDGELNAT